MSNTERNVSSHDPLDGYTRHFARRPEHFGNQVVEVVDASEHIRERPVGDLKVIYIPHLFSGSDEVFIGFGIPNTFLVFPDEQGGYTKFSGRSLRRAPAKTEDTRLLVQSGVFLRLKGLPPGVALTLHAKSQLHDGKRYWTCVNAVCRVLEDAGFTSGDTPLSDHYFPVSLMYSLKKWGLHYGGIPVEVDFIRTTPEGFEQYVLAVTRAEVLTFCRHAQRAMEPRLEKLRARHMLPAKKRRSTKLRRRVAPQLPTDVAYLGNFTVRVSQPSSPGVLLRLAWGTHSLYEVIQRRVSPREYFSSTLTAFSDDKSLLSKVKKGFLFSPEVISFIRGNLNPTMMEFSDKNEADIYDMLLTHSVERGEKYNIVINDEMLVVSRVWVRYDVIDWVLSKHVLMSGYSPNVYFAGEIWKSEDGVVYLSRNSGTYRPSRECLESALRFLRAVFPNIRIEIEDDVQ